MLSHSKLLSIALIEITKSNAFDDFKVKDYLYDKICQTQCYRYKYLHFSSFSFDLDFLDLRIVLIVNSCILSNSRTSR